MRFTWCKGSPSVNKKCVLCTANPSFPSQLRTKPSGHAAHMHYQCYMAAVQSATAFWSVVHAVSQPRFPASPCGGYNTHPSPLASFVACQKTAWVQYPRTRGAPLRLPAPAYGPDAIRFRSTGPACRSKLPCHPLAVIHRSCQNQEAY